MKYFLLLVTASMFGLCAFGQKGNIIHAAKQGNAQIEFTNVTNTTGFTSSKQTSAGDTVYMSHIALSDTITLYEVADSGYVAGMDAYGDKGFAERYDFSCYDSSLKVIGVIARFGGYVKPASVKSVTFNVWNTGQKTQSTRSTLFNSGFPNTLMASVTVPFTQLGVATADTAFDSAKVHMFAVPTPYLLQSFFVGYMVNYSWGAGLAGDTIGLYSNKDGERTDPSFTVVSAYDTTINNVNVTMYSNNTWHDNSVDNFHLNNNLYIFPIVIVGTGPAAVNGVVRNGFTFLGAYPSPASTSTNLKLNLARVSDVTVDIIGMNGVTYGTVKQNNLSAGEQNINVNTSGLAVGDYIYLIRTGSGDGIAGKFTVAR